MTDFRLRIHNDNIELRFTDSDSWIAVRLIQLRPISDRQAGISVMHASKKQELAMINAADVLDENTRAIVDSQIQRSCFIPQILRIRQFNIRLGQYYLSVETDRGEKNIVIDSPVKNVSWLSDTHCMLHDEAGNYFEIADTTQLDGFSKERLKNSF